MMLLCKDLRFADSTSAIDLEEAIDSRTLQIIGSVVVARRIAELDGDDSLMNMLWGVEDAIHEIQQAFEALRAKRKQSVEGEQHG